ncbi:two-partner secretion domain-containing protein [Hydrogenophaga sp. BPS33]|uniref:two-partner secretion domain-containing protein n=1 Tax=Hydrogenophaga sp. BPS33 TaxID=2651974 RepID=UPI00132044D8|nr:DUF637 domain-containing protein [Hydrogenophaga sp. BPS33]QHE85398.1 filamentous hemagglutinin N-terminal domain-containing protein [Hydrogenophaga sp. BPS33]
MNKHHRRVAVATATGLCSLLVIVCAQAQIVADPNAPGRQRPTVLSAPNGVPLVNIQTPSAAGVSRNTYRQFDVNGQGAILNNSRTATPTQLGGHVPGNPWLATGSARVILNEVNSTNPSYLKGPIEVAGQRAEVIVANPAGIQVNGGSFINASAVTLTTGTPVMNSGSLESFRVRGGQINVDGLGLDMRGASHAAILARAIEVNAAIWAQYLSVVGGAAEVRIEQGSATATPQVTATPIAPDPQAPSIPKPVFWLDTAAIGGMYAGKIFLVGSEDGLGVNHRGTLASQGQLTLLPNGQLINQGRIYGQDVQIGNASEVRNQEGGVIAARESLNIQAAQIHNTEGAELLSLGKMALTATERIVNRSARIEAQGDLAITTPVLVNANDHFRTELVAEPGQRYLRLRHQGVDYKAEELGMNFDRLDRYEDKAEWQVLLPSGDYPFAQYPALAAQWAVPLGGWSGSFQLEASRTEEPCPGSECNPTTRDTYAPEHPIWQRLGVTPFGPPPEPPPQGGSEDPAWQQQMAQYNAHKRAQQDALDQKIGAYNASVAARTLEDWVVIDATATAYNPKVVSSAPGQIVSGGDMAINARGQLLNHNSEIMAGGALKVQGANLESRGSEVVARTELSGQAVYSWRREEGLFKNDDRLYEHSPYQAVQERGVPINVARSQGGQAIPPVMHSGLFKPNPDPQGKTLIETDPLFTDQRQWLGSDYLLKAISVDPNSVQKRLEKRLGDGFYEQRLIREQVGQLTGQRFLGDYRDDEAQFLALMNAGLTFAQEFQLRPGITLSAEQMAALTSDIVWLVAEDVTLPDGRREKALVPRVYLAPRAGDLSPSGALIAGETVKIHMSGDVLNSGTVAGRQLVQVTAGRDIGHSGQISGDVVAMGAGRDLNIQGGEVHAKDAIVLDAGRDLNVASTTRTTTTQAGNNTFERTGIDRQARLYVSDEAAVLLAQAGRDVTLTASDIRNDGNGATLISAGRDLNLDTVRTGATDDLHWNPEHRQRTTRSEETGTRISAGGDVGLQAGQHLIARAVDIEAQGDLQAKAEGVLLIEAGQNTLEADEHHRTETKGLFTRKTVTTDVQVQQIESQRSRLQGRNVTLEGGATVVRGATIGAEEDIHIRGEHLVRLDAAQDTHQHERDTEVRRRGGVLDKGAHQSKTEIDQTTLRSQAQVAELNAGNAIHIESPQRIELLGARLQAPDIYLRRGVPAEAPIEGPDGQRDIKADLLLGAVVERDVHSSERRSESDRVWQSTASHGHELDTLVPTELHGKVHIDPGLRIGVQVPQGAPVREQARLLSEQPGLAYLGELAKRDDVDWQAIELARRQWDHEQQGLTGLGAAIVTAVVAYFTAGMGSGVVGSTAPAAAGASTTTVAGTTLATTSAAGVTTFTAAGAAVNAGFTALVSTTAVSFINNGGDLGAVLKDLGSSESVKAILTSMVTAGVAHNIGKYVSFNGKPLSDIKLADGPGAYLGKQLVEQTGRAVVNAALQGTDLEDAIVGALVSSALTTVTEFGSKTIGDLTVRDANGNVVLNPAGQKLAHALLGCAAGAVQTGSEGCAAGAAGAVLGHLAAEWIDDGTRSNADIANFAKLIAGLGGALVAMHTDGDAQSVTIASTAGENAAANNYLNHVRPHPLRLSEVEQFARASADCATGDASACQRRDALADLSRQRDRELQTACNGATPALCQQLSQQAANMGNVVRGQPGQLVWANSPDSGFVLNVATMGTPSRPGNFHDQQANNTSQALLFALPGPEDLAVGALLLTAPGKVLAEVVVQGGQKMLRFADGVLAPVGSQQAKLLAEARVRNNVYRDGGISDPTRPMSAAGPWAPAAELSTQQANQLVALSLPVGSTVTGMRSADVANALAKTHGYEAPFVPGSSIVSLNAAEGASMVRVYGGDSTQSGTWVMRAEDVAGLTAEQIASKYALPQIPTKITDVVLPKGVTLEVSIAGSVSPGASKGIYTGDNGGGGGVQFQIKTDGRVPSSWFINERDLP